MKTFLFRMSDGSEVPIQANTPDEARAKAREMQARLAPAPGMSGRDVLTSAIRNTPSSAKNLANDYLQAILNPIDTADAMLNVAAGGISRGIEAVAGDQSWLPENEATATADAVGNFYKDRYGSWEGFKRSVATDPVGVAADISVPVTMGGGALARAPGVAGSVGRVVRSTGRLMDPVSAVPEVGRLAGRRATNVAGTLTGAGSQSIYEGFDAARAGGKKAEAFYDNMRGRVPIDNVVDEAKSGLGAIKRNRSDTYRANIQSTQASTAPVNFQPIVQEFNKALDSMKQGGMWTGGDASTAMAKKIYGILDVWSKSPSAHTPWGMDGLKKRLGSLTKQMGPGVDSDVANANRLAETVRSAVENQVKASDPNYVKTMAEYAEPSNLIRELERALSLNDKASVDTALRKLQSAMRNNAQTNWGKRLDLVRELERAGADTLMPSLAGQALNSSEPRGIVRGNAGTQSLGAGGMAYLAGIDPIVAAAIAAGSWAGSIPRVAGETAGLLGTVARGADAVANVAPAPVRKAVTSPAARGATQEAGGITKEVEAMLEDAQGNLYDRRGRLIRRGKQQ